MRKLTLKRLVEDADSTIGALFLDGKFECFTLEDAYHAEKIAGQTRIPAGSYRVSPRTFGGVLQSHKKRWGHKMVFEVCDVPNYTDILIHCGNTHEHTRGCILVGSSANAVFRDMSIGNSRVAYQALYLKLCDDMHRDNINLTIEDPS